MFETKSKNLHIQHAYLMVFSFICDIIHDKSPSTWRTEFLFTPVLLLSCYYTLNIIILIIIIYRIIIKQSANISPGYYMTGSGPADPDFIYIF